MRTQDPIVEELHAIREALAEASDNDLAKIVEAARARQQTSGHPIVELPPKRVGKTQKAS
jgi:hypothetical protein